MELNDFKKNIDFYLLNFFDSKLDSLLSHQNKDIEEVFKHLKLLMQEGKRLRPYLAYLAYKMSGGKKDNEAIIFFVFIEVFHLFCLVHDDIMDDADQRHGVKTINKRYGNSQAILIGDFLFSWAWEILLTNNEFDKSAIERVKKIFLQMIDEVFIGQMIDLNISNKDKVSNEEVMQKMFLKTAGYSFIKPMMIGKALVKETRNAEFFIEDFGKHLGLAFQIQDDLLDVIRNANQTKKSSFNDITQHQHTLLSNYVFEYGTKEQKSVLKRLFGKQLTRSDKNKLRELFNISGAITYAEKEIIDNLNQAKKALEKTTINIQYKNLFLKLFHSLVDRAN